MGQQNGAPFKRHGTPAIAWWDGSLSLANSDMMFRRWASDEFSTDWGTRDVGEHESVYDPISYDPGSVWPLFTGWASLAEYHTGRDLAGHSQLMDDEGRGRRCLVLHFYEWAGTDGNLDITVSQGATGAAVINLLEAPQGAPVAVENNHLVVTVKPYEIVDLSRKLSACRAIACDFHSKTAQRRQKRGA